MCVGGSNERQGCTLHPSKKERKDKGERKRENNLSGNNLISCTLHEQWWIQTVERGRGYTPLSKKQIRLWRKKQREQPVAFENISII